MAHKPPRRSNSKRSSGQRPGQTNRIRIIGGVHRGRRLCFPDGPGLRPTADRVRETLFNWLQSQLPGARCLDLFAGSGALGLEAASRGAGGVTLLDKSQQVIVQLLANQRLLERDDLQIEQADVMQWLDQPATAYDIVFVDPPFADDLLMAVCAKLDRGGWLAAGARIYLEWDQHRPDPLLPSAWHCLREKRTGQVAYALYLSP